MPLLTTVLKAGFTGRLVPDYGNVRIKKVLLDTNLFDELFANGPAADDVIAILEYVKRKVVVGYATPKTLMDIYYLFQSEKGTKAANRRVKQAYALVEIAPQTSKEVRDAFALDWTDFEDAVQMASAKNIGADRLITLDRKFQNKDRSYVWSPTDLRSYLAQYLRK